MAQLPRFLIVTATLRAPRFSQHPIGSQHYRRNIIGAVACPRGLVFFHGFAHVFQDTQRDDDLHQVDISVRSMAGAKEQDW
jgi:hypothetical protein